MNYASSYTVEEIQQFLEISKRDEEESENEILKKLLSVKDKISIFNNIDSTDIRAIVSNLKFVKYKKKDFVVKENDDSSEIFFIFNGECQVFSGNKIVGQLKSGLVFGETGAIFKTKRNASVICASTEASLLSFSIDEDNIEFSAFALAMLYKNLALQINDKLEVLNHKFTQNK